MFIVCNTTGFITAPTLLTWSQADGSPHIFARLSPDIDTWYSGSIDDLAVVTRINGALSSSNSPAGTYKAIYGQAASPYSGSATILLIGNDPNSSGRFWDGGIAEIIIYDSALGTTDRQAVEAYLATKYGL